MHIDDYIINKNMCACVYFLIIIVELNVYKTQKKLNFVRHPLKFVLLGSEFLQIDRWEFLLQ